jgi:hypothetical protein
MFDVSCGKRSASRDCYSGNLGITKIDVASGFLASGGQHSGLVCGGTVEVDDSILKILLNQTNERGFHSSLALASHEQGNAKTRLE